MDIKPKLHVKKIFNNDLVAIHKSKIIFTSNKPAYVDMCILDLSKVLMYEFHYDYIKNKYGNKSRLLFTDTNSLIYEIKAEDAYKDFSKNKKMLDFSNYPVKSKFIIIQTNNRMENFNRTLNRIQSNNHKIETWNQQNFFIILWW